MRYGRNQYNLQRKHNPPNARKSSEVSNYVFLLITVRFPNTSGWNNNNIYLKSNVQCIKRYEFSGHTHGCPLWVSTVEENRLFDQTNLNPGYSKGRVGSNREGGYISFPHG